MSKKTRLHSLSLLLVISLALPSSWATFGADKYDDLIKASAETWMPGVDWLWWKAQVKAESAFNPLAKSPVGAMGLSQIMPATFAEIGRKSGIAGNPYAPEVNLFAGAFYMSRQRAIFKAPRPEYEKHALAMASYNAGAGHIIKAQRLAGDPPEWQPVAEKLHLVTGHHSNETAGYVRKIRQYYRAFVISGD